MFQNTRTRQKERGILCWRLLILMLIQQITFFQVQPMKVHGLTYQEEVLGLTYREECHRFASVTNAATNLTVSQNWTNM